MGSCLPNQSTNITNSSNQNSKNNKQKYLSNKYAIKPYKLFAYESLRYNYEKFKQQYSTSSNTTRRKVIIPPKYDKRINTKSSYIKVINIFNKLPNENKTLDLRKKSNKKKLKDWVSKNE